MRQLELERAGHQVVYAHVPPQRPWADLPHLRLRQKKRAPAPPAAAAELARLANSAFTSFERCSLTACWASRLRTPSEQASHSSSLQARAPAPQLPGNGTSVDNWKPLMRRCQPDVDALQAQIGLIHKTSTSTVIVPNCVCCLASEPKESKLGLSFALLGLSLARARSLLLAYSSKKAKSLVVADAMGDVVVPIGAEAVVDVVIVEGLDVRHHNHRVRVRAIPLET